MKRDDLEKYLDAKAPLFFVRTHEETRFEDLLTSIAEKRKIGFFSWSLFAQFFRVDNPDLKNEDIYTAMKKVISLSSSSIILLKDCSRLIQEPGIIRQIKEFVINFCFYCNNKDDMFYKPIFLLDPCLEIPKELEKHGVFVDFDLMSSEEILEFLKDNEDLKKLEVPDEVVSKMATNLCGLTFPEIENVVYYIQAMLKKDKKANIIETVKYQKKQLIKKSQFLEFITQEECIESVGGLRLLKDWLQQRGTAFSKEAEDYGLPKPKGILLTGIPGSGKSMVAKSIAKLWQIPLIKFDVAKLFNRFVGESERQTFEVLKLIESIAPCVLWLDEIEKGMAGIQSSTYSDAGTSARVIGTLLSWMQEQNKGVFIVGTSNNIKTLPPELLRKGRFDEIFFVSVPSASEREEIFDIHLKKRNRNVKKFDISKLVKSSSKFVGAEIEGGIIAAMYTAFADNKREFTTDDIVSEMRKTIPLAELMREELNILYNWTKDGRARSASEEDVEIANAIGFTRDRNKQNDNKTI